MSSPKLSISAASGPDSELQLLAGTIAQPVCCLNAEGCLTFCNPAFSKISGHNTQEVTGQNLVELLRPQNSLDNNSDPLAPAATFCSTASTQIPAEHFRRRDGTFFEAECWTHPLTRSDGAITYLVVFKEISGQEDPADFSRVSGEMLRQIGKNVNHMFYLLDSTASRFVYVSRACEVFTGRRCREFYRNSSLWLEAVDTAHQALFASKHVRLRDGREVWCEYKVHHRDGRVRWIKDHANPIRDPNGAVRMFAGVAEDVTAVHEAQELLIERERKFQRILASLPDVTWTADRHGNYSYISPRVQNVLGFSHRDVYTGGPGYLQARIHPEDRLRIRDSYEALFREGRLFDEEYRIATKSGAWVWIHDRAVRTHSERGDLYTDGVFSDVSDRKATEAGLQSKTAFLEALVNSTMDAILVVDGEGQVLLANQKMFDLFKIPESLRRSQHDQAMLAHATELVKDRASFLEKVHYLYDHPDECGRDIIEFKDGTILDRYSSPVVGKEGKYYGRIWTFRDITESKRNEDTLQQLSLAVEQSSVSIEITDPAGRITYVNRKFTESSGYSPMEVLGKSPRILNSGHASPDFYKHLWSTISQGKEWRGEFRNRRKTGELFWESATITPVTNNEGNITHYLAIKEDITERRLLEGQLRQAQKLEAIGQLAAGIAHEINTPTQFVMDNLTFLKDSWNSIWHLLEICRAALRQSDQTVPPEMASALNEAERACELDFLAGEVPGAFEAGLDGLRRVSKIVRAMKEFSHPDSGDKSATDLNRAIESTVTVARNEWKYVANVSTDFDPNLPLVLCFPGEMNQVILNLLVNAAHAIKDKIKEGEKGEIAVSTRLRGSFAEMAISDTGGGIPENIRTRIFEPFFTTKEVGKGTGQGLAMAHNLVVKKLGGRIWFETEVGRGTAFFVHLPISAEPSAS